MSTTKMFDKLQFNNRLGRLTINEIEYWKMMFSKILKVGEEFEVEVPTNRDLEQVRRDYRDVFQPTRSVDDFGRYGIYDVTQDGSVRNGLELITVGRRFNWNTFYDMNKMIMDKFKEMDIYTSHHTGFHIHLLAGYSGETGRTELEKAVPEIILANFYQLHRHFCPELYWIASGGCQRYALTRYMLFRRPPFDFSAIQKSMRYIQNEMNERYGKYQMFNMNRAEIMNNNNGVTRFHVEIRHPDTHLSPAYSSALVALEVAILQKAIDLSQCGIISMKQEEYDIRKELFDKFVNMGTGDRESDSSDLTDEDVAKLQQMTINMVKWFKPEIMGINHTAYAILQKMAETPASIMRINGKSWTKIEEELYTSDVVDEENKGKLIEIVVLQQITDCASAGDWKRKVSDRLTISIPKINSLLDHLGKERVVLWDRELGSMMFKQTI